MSLSEKERKLIPLLTDEFLSTLAEAGRVNGWSNDYVEVEHFIQDIYILAGKDPPNLDPYKEENNLNRFKQHIPNFVDVDNPPEWIEFKTTEDLLSIATVTQWAKPMNGKPFSHFAMSDNRLIAIYDYGFHWWVVGYIEHPLMIDLPQWNGWKYQAQMPDGTIEILTNEVVSSCGDILTLADGTKAINIRK